MNKGSTKQPPKSDHSHLLKARHQWGGSGDLEQNCTKFFALAPHLQKNIAKKQQQIAKKIQMKKILDEIAKLWMKTKLWIRAMY